MKFVGLSIIFASIMTTVRCVDLNDADLSKEELIAITRDHLARKDPDALLNGFFPVWAAIQFLIACFFLVIAILGTTCYLFGCKTPAQLRNEQKK